MDVFVFSDMEKCFAILSKVNTFSQIPSPNTLSTQFYFDLMKHGISMILIVHIIMQRTSTQNKTNEENCGQLFLASKCVSLGFFACSYKSLDKKIKFRCPSSLVELDKALVHNTYLYIRIYIVHTTQFKDITVGALLLK